MYTFQTMSSVHLPLPQDLHLALRRAAQDLGRPVTEIIREALAEWLAERERRRIAGDIEAYARAVAGSDQDLDLAWEAAGVESLLAAEGGRDERRKAPSRKRP